MRYLLLIFFCVSVLANDVVFFNPASSPIPNRVTQFVLSINELPYLNATNALVITNRAAQSAVGVTLSNLVAWCVVTNKQIRLLTQAEVDRIAATNALIDAAALAQTKYDARVQASNVVNAVDGQSLFQRAAFEATWALINFTRTNDGKAGIPRATYLSIIQTNIAEFGK